MNLVKIQEKYNTHDKCVTHLENVRWNGHIVCPFCNSDKITARDTMPKSNRGRKRVKPQRPYKTPRYHCNGCNKDFTVLIGTIFEGSKMPLPKWFMLISLMLNAKKGISAMQVSRDLDITYKTAWFSSMRVRCAMLDQAEMLEGILEMDEVFIGGKPRHRTNATVKLPHNEANLSVVSTDKIRVSNKIPVAGIVERGGKKRVVTKILSNLTTKNLMDMLKRYAKTDGSKLMTDEYKSYSKFNNIIEHKTVNHSKKEYVRGNVHTNTIEGFWSIIKNGIRGQYHVISGKYLPFYLAEFSYKYNRRMGNVNAFDEMIETSLNKEKCAVKYKPIKEPKKLAYPRKKRKKVSQE